MAAGVERVSAIIAAVNKYLLDTGLHSERLSIITFLRALAEDYGRGEITMGEMEKMIKEIAENIVALAASVGKSLLMEEVHDELRKAVYNEATKMSALLLPEKMARMRLRRRRREEEGLV